MNVPKFLQDDLKLFNGIVSDLFPKIKEQPIDYGNLEESIKKACLQLKIEEVPEFITKCIQLFETIVVRHGLMLVGPTGSGKTKVSFINILCAFYVCCPCICMYTFMYVCMHSSLCMHVKIPCVGRYMGAYLHVCVHIDLHECG